MKRLFLMLGAAGLLMAFKADAQTPVILSEPQSVTVNNASAADFTVVATNAAAYQWYFQGTNRLAGATNATLSLDDVSSNQAGSYTVVVISSNNVSVTSAPPVILTIVPGTIIQWTISTYPNGGSSNFLVQLFDHDKPATVENFIHYITSGSYSNTFFDRDVTGFVVQGGDYVTADRLATNLSPSQITPGTNFPSQLENEFGVGPLIHNYFGTLAMGLQSGKTNSASSAFYFNLADNSASLDYQDFTVFGRIIAGTNNSQNGSNILQYFNTLSPPTNGIYSNYSQVPNLPVNYDGTNSPMDGNFFYCDFAFFSPTNPPVYTNLPAVSIAFPAPNAVFTNGSDLTVTGTASVAGGGLAEVFCVLNTLEGENEGRTETNAASGTGNWELDLGTNEPGVYQLTAYAQDGAGNLSAPVTQYFTNLAILTIVTNLNGQLSTNEQYLVPGQQYSVSAEPGAGEKFVNWQIESTVSLDPLQSFLAETNFTVEVTYISTNLPAGLAITSPAADSTVQTTNAGLTISGTVPPSITVTQLTVQLFAQSNAATAAVKASIHGTNWSAAVSNLVGGPYTIVAVAEDSLGQEGLVTENFDALVAPPIIISQPRSVTVNTGSSADFSVIASNVVSYQWQLAGGGAIAGATNSTLALNDVSSNLSGSAYVVILTAPDREMVTSAPPAVLTVVPGTIIQWTISKYADGSSSNFLVELFDHDKPATVQNFIHYVASGSYSNTFFDTDLTNFLLAGGDFVTADRTSTNLNYNNVSTGTNVFPVQIDSEYNVGPLIPNTYGTLAASASGNSGAGTGGFFFNLADNSTNLDGQGYTVFGRILMGTNAGSNILQYFNTLSSPGNGISAPFSGLTNLPVNYDGAHNPGDANLFYCDFAFPTPPPVDTNVPTVSITYPLPNSLFSNSSQLTITGTASNDFAFAEVFCVLTPLTGVNAGESQTNVAVGTTNWSLDLGGLNPGIYQLSAFAQDAAGNLSAPATEYFTNLVQLTLITNVIGQGATNALEYLVPGQQYSVAATPGIGQQFYSWISNRITSLNPIQSFVANDDLTLTVTYLPASSALGLTIASPVSGGQALSIQSVLTISGSLASTNVAGLTCQFFVQSNSVSAPLPANLVGTNWSLTVTNYPNGSNYTVVALATNATAGGAFALADFKVLNVEMLTLKTVGEGTIVNTNFLTNEAPYVVPGPHTFKALPAKGYVFYSWTDGISTTLNPSYELQISSNLTLTATFVPQDTSLTGLSFTYPPANAMLTNGSFNLAGKASATFTNVTCQIFLQSNGVTALPQSVNFNTKAAEWTLPLSNLTAGAYTVLAMGYDNKGNSRLVSENFNLLSKLTVNVQGKGTVTAGLNGKFLQVGKSYPISATPKAGQILEYWNGPVADSNLTTTTFVMSTNTVLTAYFGSNLFPAVAGTYTGVFLNSEGVAPTNSGFVTVTTTDTGVFTGQVQFPSRTYPVDWEFPYNGFTVLTGKGFDSNILEFALDLDLTNGTDTITGFLADVNTAGSYIWASSFVLYRAVTSLAASNAPSAGKYVLLLQPESSSNGLAASGYAAVSLSPGGGVATAGTLPDNTAISLSARMSKDGIWPLYMVPASYKQNGMIIGWQTNMPSGICSGQLFWCKPGLASGLTMESTGGLFAAPAAKTQYQMVLAGGMTNVLQVSQARQFLAQSNIPEISLLSTGALSGILETNKERLTFKGAFINPSAGGAGFIIGTNGTTTGFQILPQE